MKVPREEKKIDPSEESLSRGLSIGMAHRSKAIRFHQALVGKMGEGKCQMKEVLQVIGNLMSRRYSEKTSPTRITAKRRILSRAAPEKERKREAESTKNVYYERERSNSMSVDA